MLWIARKGREKDKQAVSSQAGACRFLLLS
jgi:hypothetical protein